MEEFEGELKSIPPSKLIKKDKSNDFDNFFLVLGLIYNDLKDLILFTNLIQKNYRQPRPDVVEPASVHLGQLGGVNNHLNRLAVGFMSEFIIFLRQNKKVINNINFMLLIKNLPPEARKNWNHILGVLEDKDSDDFLSKIAKIRSNVAFHYDQSLKEIRSGFIKKFYDSPPNEYNKKAFYSLGDNIETTRFYYCDGAVDEYYRENVKFTEENSYHKEVKNLIEKTNISIRHMMEAYLKTKAK